MGLNFEIHKISEQADLWFLNPIDFNKPRLEGELYFEFVDEPDLTDDDKLNDIKRTHTVAVNRYSGYFLWEIIPSTGMLNNGMSEGNCELNKEKKF